MQKVSIQNILIGIGIGMMLTSSFNMFSGYLAVTTIKDNLTEYSNNVIENSDSNILNEELETENIVEQQKNEEPNSTDYYQVEIKKGMTTELIAEHLKAKNIIEDTSEFVELAMKLRITTKFISGYKNIPHGSTLEEIMSILTKI